jgi:DNA primase
MSAGRGSLLSQAITLVLHHPAAAQNVAGWSELAGCELPGIAVLTELLEQATGMAQPNTAMLLERWRERPEYGRLSELAAAAGMVETTAAASQELQMAVQKLKDSVGPGRRMNELLRKADEMGLNYEEKAELSSLLKAKAHPGGGG